MHSPSPHLWTAMPLYFDSLHFFYAVCVRIRRNNYSTCTTPTLLIRSAHLWGMDTEEYYVRWTRLRSSLNCKLDGPCFLPFLLCFNPVPPLLLLFLWVSFSGWPCSSSSPCFSSSSLSPVQSSWPWWWCWRRWWCFCCCFSAATKWWSWSPELLQLFVCGGRTGEQKDRDYKLNIELRCPKRCNAGLSKRVLEHGGRRLWLVQHSHRISPAEESTLCIGGTSSEGRGVTHLRVGEKRKKCFHCSCDNIVTAHFHSRGGEADRGMKFPGPGLCAALVPFG